MTFENSVKVGESIKKFQKVDQELGYRNAMDVEGKIMICRRCGSVGVIRTSWTSTNPGRRFFGCSKRGTNCGIIDWYDPPMCDRAVQIIPGLLRRINHLQQTLADYQAPNVDQIVDYQGENDEAVADQNHVDYQMQARRMKWFQLLVH
ncbi:zinc finger, GRF-type containing protein [Tanacetum coccineum]